jgi:hypothetical protein
MPSLNDKIYISVVSAILFLLVSLPMTYQITNSLGLRTLQSAGCPSWVGIFLHTAVFGLLSFVLMLIPNFP